MGGEIVRGSVPSDGTRCLLCQRVHSASSSAGTRRPARGRAPPIGAAMRGAPPSRRGSCSGGASYSLIRAAETPNSYKRITSASRPCLIRAVQPVPLGVRAAGCSRPASSAWSTTRRVVPRAGYELAAGHQGGRVALPARRRGGARGRWTGATLVCCRPVLARCRLQRRRRERFVSGAGDPGRAPPRRRSGR